MKEKPLKNLKNKEPLDNIILSKMLLLQLINNYQQFKEILRHIHQKYIFFSMILNPSLSLSLSWS